VNGLRLNLPESVAGLMKDSDNVLIMVLILMLMKEKSNRALIISLMSILMQA